MKKIVFFYGVTGVILIFLSAVFRLLPYSLEAFGSGLSLSQLIITILYLINIIVGKGYFAMHKGFSPRAVDRALEAAEGNSITNKIFAPLYCIGFSRAPAKRLRVTYSIFFFVISFVILARFIPQPWRGILDFGPVVGLSIGILSAVYHSFRKKINNYDDITIN